MYSVGPPRNSYIPTKTPIQAFWYNRVPSSVKYFGLIGLSAFTFTHVHPNVLVTVGPPVLVAGYYGYKQLMKRIYQRETKKLTEVKPGNDIVQIRKYDESEMYNVLNGLENQFQHFTHQILEVAEKRIVDYVIEVETRGLLENRTVTSISQMFMDENHQISVHLGKDLETFVMLKVGEDDFIKLSLPFYDSNDRKRRLGTVQIYLLQQESKNEAESFIQYRMGIEISQYMKPGSIFFTSVGEGVYKSKVLLDNESDKERDDIEETIEAN
ncbi:uncharacterized protein CANTADRAFT_26094 [Suhomyces tanzawaensis NRRL Y-17324]|uniref:Uncharacterized protein n=1 Tax=Suhomyces tanzawaensis NRRL Y-17324 TaxID=984487 RepID=A0A1E4SHV8_9ASCO|nr:uncharacterized protein CANTADRAFT_26094 [Suhomyces tanzawaensis NRRL Y-17324]ODV79012.1 hypothetical protein CANTADRAFT_26094 [Suhomyces tanzawaensis NRRL Y-17324]